MGTDRNTIISVDREKIKSEKSTGSGLCMLFDKKQATHFIRLGRFEN